MHVKDIVRDVKHWMSFIPYKPVEDIYRVGFMAGLTIPPYELPDGTKINNNEKICTAAERWFIPENKMNSSSSSSSSTQNSNSSNNADNGSSSSSSSSRGNNSRTGNLDSNYENNNSNNKNSNSSNNAIIDYDNETLQSLVHLCLTKCDNDVRKDLLSNIVIVGGGSLIDGVSNRLTYELNELIPSTMKVRKKFSPKGERRVEVSYLALKGRKNRSIPHSPEEERRNPCEDNLIS